MPAPQAANEGDFNMKVAQVGGNFTYSDSSAGISFTSTKITNATFSGNSAQFTAKGTSHGNQMTATVNVTDNGPSGTSDTFSVGFNTGYSRGGTLTSGNITVD
jgi:hypothetical protein